MELKKEEEDDSLDPKRSAVNEEEEDVEWFFPSIFDNKKFRNIMWSRERREEGEL